MGNKSLVLELIDEYEENKKTFSNRFNNKSSNFRKSVVDVCGKELLDTYNNKLGHFFYDILQPFEKTKLCKRCENKEVIFLSYNKGYSEYCSKTCATQYYKLSKEQKKESTIKRNKTMVELKKNEEWFDNYKRKLSIASKITNSKPEARMMRSLLLKEKIKNGEFTPNITNTWTHWTIIVEGKKFRSSFEGLFYFYNKEMKNKILNYEKLRINYTYENIDSIYIVDFIDEEKKIVYEIKPESLLLDDINIAKFESLKAWCKENDYTFVVIDETHLKVYHRELLEKYKEEFIVKFFTEKYKWNL